MLVPSVRGNYRINLFEVTRWNDVSHTVKVLLYCILALLELTDTQGKLECYST